MNNSNNPQDNVPKWEKQMSFDKFIEVGQPKETKGAEIFIIAHLAAEKWATFDPDAGEPDEIDIAKREEAYRSYIKAYTQAYYDFLPVVKDRIAELEKQNIELKQILKDQTIQLCDIVKQLNKPNKH